MRLSVEAIQNALSPSSPEPLYFQIVRLVKDGIAKGRLKSGQFLPGEPDLARHLGVSRDTIRHAVRRLIAEGILEIQRGRGTIIGEQPIEQELVGLTGFVEDMLVLGLEPSARLLSVRKVPPTARVKEHLGLTGDAEVVEIRRVRLANDAPISYDVTWLPCSIGDRVAAEDLERSPIFSILEDKYGIPLTEADYRIKARRAAREVAEALNLRAGSPVLEIERTSFTAQGPIDHEQLFYRADRITFRMRLKRKRSS